MELAHQASYRNNTLGLPSLCPRDNITKIKVSKLFILSIYVCVALRFKELFEFSLHSATHGVSWGQC